MILRFSKIFRKKQLIFTGFPRYNKTQKSENV